MEIVSFLLDVTGLSFIGRSLGMTIAALAVLSVTWIGVWYAIRRREKSRAARGLASHSGLRLVLAAGVMLMMLFSGGCTLFYFATVLQDYMTLSSTDTEGGKLLMGIAGMILLVGGVPFTIALVLWAVLMHRKQP